MKYIGETQFQYNRSYIKTIKSLLLNGDKEIAQALTIKYLDSTQLKLWPDEKPGTGAPSKYRPYLKYQKGIEKTNLPNGRIEISIPEDIRFGLGISTSDLFNYVKIMDDCRVGNTIIYETALGELQRMRIGGLIDSGRHMSILYLITSKRNLIRSIKHDDLACEMIYVYSCYENWPSIRNQIDLTLGGILENANALLTKVDDEGIEAAIEYVNPSWLSKFRESGDLHKKAAPPIGVNLN